MSGAVRVTQEDIDRYASVSGDHNPIHVDVAYAESSRFGRTIAHGMMTLGYLLDQVEAHTDPETWASGGAIDVRFRAPVYSGDVMQVTGLDLLVARAVPVTATIEVGDRVCVTAEVTSLGGGAG